MGCRIISLDIQGEDLAEDEILQSSVSTGADRNERKQRNDELNEYLQLVLNGLFTGLGASIGAYLAARVFIHHLEVLEKRLKNNEEAKTK